MPRPGPQAVGSAPKKSRPLLGACTHTLGDVLPLLLLLLPPWLKLALPPLLPLLLQLVLRLLWLLELTLALGDATGAGPEATALALAWSSCRVGSCSASPTAGVGCRGSTAVCGCSSALEGLMVESAGGSLGDSGSP